LAAVHTRSASTPVTARLSQKFYERLGEEVANELVDWFNAVDATYRNDLRELNELNFQRFDAKVEQRFADLRAEIERRLAELRIETSADLAALRRAIADQRADLIRWMFGFWIATLVPLAGLMVGLFTLWR
jgi:hypothetical protein